MAIDVRIEFDLGEIESFEMIPQGARKKAFQQTAMEYIRVSKELTNMGLDAEGKAFAPYSEEYADQKERSGREPNLVNLTLTGNMRRSQKAEFDEDGLRVVFRGTQPRTVFRTTRTPRKGRKRATPGGPLTVSRTRKKVQSSILAERNDRLRPFIGVSVQTLAHLFGFFLDVIEKESKRLDKKKNWKPRFR